MTPEQATLAERVRTLLASEQLMREKSMFGVRSFKVNEKMVVGARKDGGLLVRVDAGRHDEFLGKPGATHAEMGTGRTMGPGWIEVAPDAIGTDEALSEWLGIALDHNRTLTGPTS
ncbi:MAG: TfoX/Sxy family protein [Micropruina sp.]|uniref:TfoX/Sxy family protein n=1 Tax=Micropruina sp. TaxID=2737536 RepID=UPI0039E26608